MLLEAVLVLNVLLCCALQLLPGPLCVPAPGLSGRRAWLHLQLCHMCQDMLLVALLI